MYQIRIDTTGDGTLTATPASAAAGETVTLTAAPYANRMFRASTMEITGDVTGNRIYTDPSVTTPLIYTFIMPAEDVTVTGEFYLVGNNTSYVTDTNDSGAGSLRQAIADVPNGGTVQTELPAGSVIALNSTIDSIKKSLVIEGNGVTLTRSALWVPGADSLLRNGLGETALTVTRMHFKNAESSGNGTAIRWDAPLTLKSCIFSDNVNNSAIARAAAIYKAEGDALISGCTFYNNIANNSAVVGFGGGGMTLTLIGNLFYGNGNGTPENNNFPIVGPGFGSGVPITPSYNVVDVGYGLDKDKAGWEKGTGDTTFECRGITGIPFDTTTFVPVSQLDNFMPSPLPSEFPTTDFYGVQRAPGGAPGAVNAAQ
jgi:hypothetical protein